jgi:hypothetical protein
MAVSIAPFRTILTFGRANVPVAAIFSEKTRVDSEAPRVASTDGSDSPTQSEPQIWIDSAVGRWKEHGGFLVQIRPIGSGRRQRTGRSGTRNSARLLGPVNPSKAIKFPRPRLHFYMVRLYIPQQLPEADARRDLGIVFRRK